MTVAVFDIDNCLADDNHRLHLIDLTQPNIDDRYKTYHEAARNDLAHNHHIVSAHVRAGHQIVFNTSRPEQYRLQTWSWLNNNFDLPDDTLLFMRPPGNHEHSKDLKPQILLQEFVLEDIYVAYDDHQEVIAAYRNVGINAARIAIHPTQPQSHCLSAVESLLHMSAKTYAERNKVYGDSYKVYGKLMHAMFPDGLSISDEQGFNRLGVFNMLVSKMTRYAANLQSGGHKDSAHDMIVYAAMLEELTNEASNI